MINLPVITSSWLRNPLRIEIPPGITGSWSRNLSEEWNSARNYSSWISSPSEEWNMNFQLLDADLYCIRIIKKKIYK
jgi:hypothetical protein